MVNKKIGFCVTAMVCALVATVIALRFMWKDELADEHSSKQTIFGMISVLSCILTFGCYGIFIKSPSVQELQIDPGVFQVYLSIGVSGTLMCVAFYTPTDFDPIMLLTWGIIGAGLLVPCQIFGYIAINNVGYAVGPAVWAGLTMVVSFLWGVLMFKEELESLPGSIGGLCLLCVGIGGAAMCQSEVPNRVVGMCFGHSEDEQRSLLSVQSSKPSEGDSSQSGGGGSFIIGITAAIVVGVLNGSLMVPFHYYSKAVSDPNAAISYSVNFAAGIAIVTLPVVFTWFLIKHGTNWPPFHFYRVGLQGLVTGFYWACGYFLATYATQYLGNAVGYPLTQTCILVNGLWGILYYKEIRGKVKVSLFAMSALIIIGGAAVLAKFGTK
ncbi:transmembrane protein 144 homolog A-like [Sycon ciliatum]|uniref:transmembrane protein 144 homolog A-like n=1 Tax=Sycon ciliatum TaxID=27933 RepID=UPI0020ACCE76|eukprot:scpid48393/ scgid3714/ 